MEMRIEGELAFEPSVGEAGDHGRARAVAECQGLAAVGDERKIAVLHDAAEQDFKRLEHGHASSRRARLPFPIPGASGPWY